MPTIAFIILFVIIASFAWGALLAAPWVPTLKAQRDLLVDHLAINPKATIYDLGCGSGSILFAFADRYPHARCIGYDVAIFPLLLGLFRKIRSPRAYRNVSLRFGNFFTKHFTDADVVVAFLMQKAYGKFIKKLSAELRPDTIIAFEAWPLPHHHPTQVIQGEKLLPWYVYRWPI